MRRACSYSLLLTIVWALRPIALDRGRLLFFAPALYLFTYSFVPATYRRPSMHMHADARVSFTIHSVQAIALYLRGGFAV